MENEKQLIFIDDKGDEVLCDILFTFDSEEFKKAMCYFHRQVLKMKMET